MFKKERQREGGEGIKGRELANYLSAGAGGGVGDGVKKKLLPTRKQHGVS